MYIARYEKLKALYVEMQSKESTKKYLALEKAFKEKANYEGGVKGIVDKAKKGINAIHEWARNNVEKTGFKHIDEIEREIFKIKTLNFQIIGENRELYAYLIETSEICKDLPVELILELGKIYGKNLKL